MALALAFGLDLGLSVAHAADPGSLKPVSITIAHSEAGDPTNHIHGAALAFKEFVETKSGGNLSVKIAAGGALGDADACMMQVMSGTLEIAGSIADGSFAAVHPDTLVFSIPYLFRNDLHAMQVVHGEFGKKFWTDYAKVTGTQVLASVSAGFRSTTNSKRPIKSPDDFKGMKIRTMNMPAHMEIMKALGANVTPLSWTELYSALQTGVIDGQENGLASIYMGNLYEVQKYLTLDGHVWTIDAFIMSTSWLESLPEQYRSIVEMGGLVMQEVMARLCDAQTDIAREFLPTVMEVYSPSRAELDAYRDACQKPVLDFIRKNVKNPALVDEVIAAADKALVDLGYKK
jgi:tripartite ATP-independent transporter DctP family solute receptor